MAQTAGPVALYLPQTLAGNFGNGANKQAKKPGYAETSIALLWNVFEPVYNSLNPQAGFDFTALDSLLSATSSKRNNKIIISVFAGTYTPAWVYATPYKVAPVLVTVAPDSGGGTACLPNQRYPLVWDGQFAKAYADMMQGLADHLRQVHALRRVIAVKTAAIGLHSAEFALPVSAGCANVFAQNNQAWLDAGFTDAKLRSAWNTIEADIAAIFPNAKLIQPVLQTAGAEIPSPTGHIGSETNFPGNIIGDGVQTYGARFISQSNNISNVCGPQNAQTACPPVSDTIANAKLLGSNVAFQVNAWFGPCGTGCNGTDSATSTLCLPNEYHDMMSHSNADGALWTEVHSTDPVPPSITQSQSCVGGN